MGDNSFGVNIESNFKDYYDFLSCGNKAICTYNRVREEESRGSLLKVLRESGIKTIDLKAVREHNYTDEDLVVYTDPTLHGGKGKHLMKIEHAREMYGSQLASKFYKEANGITLKFLQIGSRRFRLTMQADTKELNKSLDEGKVIDIQELNPELNYSIMYPIFSIDYISNGSEMIAIDFNKVQKLDKLGMDKILKPEEVMKEIKKALMAYNKLG